MREDLRICKGVKERKLVFKLQLIIPIHEELAYA